jgi:hypothetical protein
MKQREMVMSKDIVARARERMNDAPMDTEHLIEELIEEVENLRRAINRINQIVVANQPSSV